MHLWTAWEWQGPRFGAGFFRRSCERPGCCIHEERSFSEMWLRKDTDNFAEKSSPYDALFGTKIED